MFIKTSHNINNTQKIGAILVGKGACPQIFDALHAELTLTNSPNQISGSFTKTGYLKTNE